MDELAPQSTLQTPPLLHPDYDMDDSIGYLVARVRQVILCQLTKDTSQWGLTATQATMLYKVASGKCSTAADLAREYCIDASAVTRLLDRLEKQGLLRRERSQTDRRTINLSVTAKGKSLTQRFPDIFVDAANHLMQGFSASEVDVLKQLLRRIIANGGTK